MRGNCFQCGWINTSYVSYMWVVFEKDDVVVEKAVVVEIAVVVEVSVVMVAG